MHRIFFGVSLRHFLSTFKNYLIIFQLQEITVTRIREDGFSRYLTLSAWEAKATAQITFTNGHEIPKKATLS